MVILTLVSDLHHPVRQEQLEKSKGRGSNSRTLDGVLRIVARDLPQYQSLLLVHQVRQRYCHRPTYRLGHPRLPCRFVRADGKRLRRSEAQQAVYWDVFYGHRVSGTTRALLAPTGRPCWE